MREGGCGTDTIYVTPVLHVTSVLDCPEGIGIR